ncbi:MAG: LPS assembly protein LptD [Desulfobacterales bacterium]
MSYFQNYRLMPQDHVDHCGKVPACSNNAGTFPGFLPYPRRESRALKLARICKTLAWPVLILFIMIGISNYASAEEQFQRFQDDPNKPWHIVADEISYDDKTNHYIARGNVIITKNEKNLSADFIRFDQKTMKVFAEGNVIMTVGEDFLTSSSMEMNLDDETGTLYDGTIFLQENHFYIKGNKIQKVGKDSYTADKVSITSCDGDSPAWKITGRNLKVTVEGYGFLSHAALWAKKVPVLYSPFLAFPAKLKRQSGLLMPQFGYSDRKGAEYIQPLYWAINESSDATFYLHYMGYRGEKLGLEYRYVLDDRSKGTLMYDYLNDRKIDDGSFDSSEKWGYEDDDYLRTNSDRYWFRMKHDQALPFGFFAKLDIDFVSDQDYLYEFRDGYTGFYATEDYFDKNFGRGLDEYDDPVRINRLNLNKIWSLYSLNAEARWYDDVIIRSQNEVNNTLQKLPFIEFNGIKQKILKSPFYFDLDFEYIHFYSLDGARGHWMDAHSRLYLPYSFNNYFTVEPSIGVRETVWNVDKDESSTLDKKTQSREMYDIKVDFSSEIYNIFQLKGESIERIKYSIAPQIVYEYIPEKDQDEFPDIFDLGRIEKKNLLTYSITNTFTSKSKQNAEKKDTHLTDNIYSDENNEPTSYSYNQFCRFKLEQSYDINIEKDKDPDTEPFSPIYGELAFVPKRYLSMQADAEWSQYESRFISHNVATSIKDTRGDKLFVEYRYERDINESIYTNLFLKVSGRLSVFADYERNISDDKDIRSGMGFLYEKQCWSFNFNYIKEEYEHKYEFMINLFGIGGFGY